MARGITKVECWARIPDEEERKAAMRWVRSADLCGYSEIGDKVSVTFVRRPDDPNGDERMWEVINFFGQYSEHGIFGANIISPQPRP